METGRLSLRKSIAREGFLYGPGMSAVQAELVGKSILDQQTILVDATAVFNQLDESLQEFLNESNPFRRLVDSNPLTPVHRRMWIEGRFMHGRIGYLVDRRGQGGVEHSFKATVFALVSDQGPVCKGAVTVHLTADGMTTDIDGGYSLEVPKWEDLSEAEEKNLLLFASMYLLSAQAMLNCKNVHLSVQGNPRSRNASQKSTNKGVTFHEIRVGDIRKSQTTGRSIFGSTGAMSAILRRGTYRNAPNHPVAAWRGRFWIPEHWSGDRSLGESYPQYRCV